MYVAYIDEGNSTGPVAPGGLNRKAGAGETQLVITPQHLNYAPDHMNGKMYHVVAGVFQKKEQVDIDTIVSEDELETSLANKLVELHTEMQSRMDAAVPVSNSKSKDKLLARQIKLLRKESQARANASEIAELDASEALDDYLDSLTDTYDNAEVWLEDPSRTLLEIQGYDVTVDPIWPVGV